MPRPVRRRLQRKWRQPLAGLALLLALGPAPALAATINVDGINCTLVDAITAANTDNAIGGCTAGSGADTIVLPANSIHTLTTVNNATDGGNGLPVVNGIVTIVGNGATIARSQAAGVPDFRVLAVDAATVTLQGLTLKGGSTLDMGGGLFSRASDLTITDSTITGNTAERGGGVAADASILTMTNSTITGNTAEDGGGVAAYASELNIINSTVSSNRAEAGGGVYTVVSDNTLRNSTVSGNTASDVAGGLFQNVSELIVTNSTFSGNTGGVYAGGVLNANGEATLTNSTISGNSVGLLGGGLVNTRGIMSLVNTTVTGNSADIGGGVYSDGLSGSERSDVVLIRSLVSGNTATSGAELHQRSGGVITASNFNLFGHSGLSNAQAFFGFTPGATDITATSDGPTPTGLASILSPTLSNNGGLSRTHALALGSPAIDAVQTDCPLPNTDQRGVPRAQDGNNDTVALCDIGAFERVRPGTVTCDGLPANKIGTPASETIAGTPGSDVIQGFGGNDVIRGLAGNDVICGGPGNDRLFGGSAADRLFGGAGRDRLNGELGFDRCNGGPPAAGDTGAACEQLSNVP